MSAATQPVELAGRIAVTGRGALYRVARDAGAVVRVIDPRYCDGRFHEGLDRLRRAAHPSTATIVAEGWIGQDFFLQYRLDGRWETLAEHFQHQHWRARAAVVARLCDVAGEWAGSGIHPIGLNGSNIVMLEMAAGVWFPWLLPCPPLEYASPCEWFDVAPGALAAVAPEIVRGLPVDYRAVEMYALGAILWQALGAAEAQGTPEDLVEFQARNSGFGTAPLAADIESFLRDLDAVRSLVQIARRCTHSSVLARPASLNDVKAACEGAVAATEPIVLARLKVAAADSREALRILDWGFSTFGEDLDGRVLAADICEKIEEYARAAAHLTAAIALAARRFDLQINLRIRRGEVRWRLYRKLPPLEPGVPDPEGDALLADLKFWKEICDSKDIQPYERAARVYLRRGDLYSAAEELCEASEREQSDMAVLYRYAKCLSDLGGRKECGEAVATAHYRLDRMVLSDMMDKEGADRWRGKFNSLL